MYVDKENIQLARIADLYSFLRASHGELFRQCGTSIYMKGNRSLYIKSGFHGYRDFATGETGNGIDFLTRHLGYSFQEAVLALAGFQEPVGKTPHQEAFLKRDFSIPVPAPLPHKRLFAFLTSRGIPGWVVDRLSSDGLVYQENGTGNAVFINKEKDYCELRGTFTYTKKPFHGCQKTRPDRFWYFIPEEAKPQVAYITESAIDAVSLWLLQRDSRNAGVPVYISIGGVANYSTIDRITRNIETVIAMDNDRAGDICRDRYKKLKSIIPHNKDWNDDLQSKASQN